MPCTRRDWLATSISLAMGGCLGSPADGTGTTTPNPTGTTTGTPELPDDLRVVDGTPTVKFPAIADGDASISDGSVVEYAPQVDATFTLGALHEGSGIEAPATSETLRVTTELPAGGPPTCYPAPVYREGAGFEYRFYANEAFVAMHDWHVSMGTGNVFDDDGVGSRPAAFEPHYQHAHRDVVTADLVADGAADEPLSVVVTQYPFEELRATEPDDVTGILLFGQSGPVQTPPPRGPQVNFSLDRDGSTLTITHRGGDTLDADNLVVRIDGTPTATQWADEYEQVSEGDTLSIDVSEAPESAYLRLGWESDDGTSSTVLLVFSLS